MFELIKEIVGLESLSSDAETMIIQGSIVLIIVFCVATVDLISQFISVFTRIK